MKSLKTYSRSFITNAPFFANEVGVPVTLFAKFNLERPSGNNLFIEIGSFKMNRMNMVDKDNSDKMYFDSVVELYHQLSLFLTYLKNVKKDMTMSHKQYVVCKDLTKRKKNYHVESILCHYGVSHRNIADHKGNKFNVGVVKFIGQHTIFTYRFDSLKLTPTIRNLNQICKELDKYIDVLYKGLTEQKVVL